VAWYMRDETAVEHIQQFHHNPKYLSDVEIHPERVQASSDLQSVLDQCQTIILAIPSAFLHQSLEQAHLDSSKFYVSAIKGIEPHSRKVMAEYLQQTHGIPDEHIGLISGPCHAEEVALEKLSYLTVSSHNTAFCFWFAQQLRCRYIHVKETQDLLGAEYAAVLKNIYAIGAGIAHGLGYGDNFQAVFVSAAIREMKAFLNEVHLGDRDIKDPAYLGDLLVTAYSQYSRNRRFGNLLGRGLNVKQAQSEMSMVAEGYYATELVHLLAESMDFHMPLVEAVYEVAYKGASARRIFRELAAQHIA
ncbi:MAG: NAD(P)H-dependent glycerol-3-phosphate dehydrogenase, partial [Bacteroidia bacterium]